MDLRMPDVDGVTATSLIAGDPALAGVRVVVLTTFDDDESVFSALRAGASGFLVKDVEPDDLLRAVRVAARGEALLSPSVTRAVIEKSIAREAMGGEQPDSGRGGTVGFPRGGMGGGESDSGRGGTVGFPRGGMGGGESDSGRGGTVGFPRGGMGGEKPPMSRGGVGGSLPPRKY